jgi:predicted metal-binding membrane protein
LAIVFAACAAKTIATGASMSAMAEMPMPGGWTMSHMWMLMPGQSWLGATASFVGMWVVMMVAMMLPSVTPALVRYNDSLGRASAGRGSALTVVVGVGYFGVWAVLGAAIFPVGVMFADVAMREPAMSRVIPAAKAAVVLFGGLIQFAIWKAPHLSLCRTGFGHGQAPTDLSGAWRYGLRLGLHCCQSCAGLTLLVLSLGAMDSRVMLLATVAVTARHFASERNARYYPAPSKIVEFGGPAGVHRPDRRPSGADP